MALTRWAGPMNSRPSILGRAWCGSQRTAGVVGELVQRLHPALVDEDTWRNCQEVTKRNVRKTSKAWTKHTYPLIPILRCARCGGPMHGEADSRKGRIQRYYGCHVARRNRSAVHPSGPRCDARMFKSELLEDAIHHELSQLVPSGEMHAALRNRLRSAGRATASRKSMAAAIQRLDAQLDRRSDFTSTASTTGRGSASDATSSTHRSASSRILLRPRKSTSNGANHSSSTSRVCGWRRIRASASAWSPASSSTWKRRLCPKDRSAS